MKPSSSINCFAAPFTVIEGGQTAARSGFSIIHAQLLNREGAGDRRAGRTRDRYEAFARAGADTGDVLLRFVETNQAPSSAMRPGPGCELEDRLESSPPSTEANDQDNWSAASSTDRRTEGKS